MMGNQAKVVAKIDAEGIEQIYIDIREVMNGSLL